MRSVHSGARIWCASECCRSAGQCDFTIPSLLERGEIVAAVGRANASVLASACVQLETLLPQNLGPCLKWHANSAWVMVLNAGSDRRQFWEAAFAGEPAKLAVSGAFDHVIPALETLLQQHARGVRDKNQGRVAIVGAGPGDPELLTLKAFRLIQDADIVFYDRLVGVDILDLIRRDASRVSVGKAKANHTYHKPRSMTAWLTQRAGD